MKSITLLGGHLAPWGKHQELLLKAFDVFLTSLEFKASGLKPPPSWKTISDRFRKNFADRKAEMAKALTSTGTAEVYREREQLLDDIIHEMREKIETKWDVKDKKTADDKRILQAGEDMRETAIKRQRRRKKSISSGSMAGNHSDEELDLIQKDMVTRKEADAAQYLLQKEHLSLEQKRENRDAEHQVWIKEIEARRVDVDERRTALEERSFEAEEKIRKKEEESDRLELDERKALIGVLGGMARKPA